MGGGPCEVDAYRNSTVQSITSCTVPAPRSIEKSSFKGQQQRSKSWYLVISFIILGSAMLCTLYKDSLFTFSNFKKTAQYPPPVDVKFSSRTDKKREIIFLKYLWFQNEAKNKYSKLTHVLTSGIDRVFSRIPEATDNVKKREFIYLKYLWFQNEAKNKYSELTHVLTSGVDRVFSTILEELDSHQEQPQEESIKRSSSFDFLNISTPEFLSPGISTIKETFTSSLTLRVDAFNVSSLPSMDSFVNYTQSTSSTFLNHFKHTCGEIVAVGSESPVASSIVLGVSGLVIGVPYVPGLTDNLLVGAMGSMLPFVNSFKNMTIDWF